VPLVKICGMRSAADARAAVDAGADLIGLHFCDSRRRVTPDEAHSIVDGIEGVKLVGVFIDPSPEEIEAALNAVPLDYLQLHGSETPGDWLRPVIKVLKVKEGVIPEPDGWPDPIMLDRWTPDQRGGTGEPWDWDLAAGLISRRSVFLAGGLNPSNVGPVVERLRPYGVDVSSGVESSVGLKDEALMRAFVAAAKQ
jgi:phosphoribosylanthranilate isomerase